MVLLGLSHNGPENLSYTIVKYAEMFYDCHKALTPAVVKVNKFYPCPAEPRYTLSLQTV